MPLSHIDLKFESKTSAETSVLLSGWATNRYLFKNIANNQNRLSIDRLHPKTHLEDIATALDHYTIDNATLIGFSLGAYYALSLAQAMPTRFKKLILIGLRPSYSKTEILSLKQNIQRNPEASLTAFYKACVSSKDEWTALKKDLETSSPTWTKNELLDGLDYLEQTQIHDLPQTVDIQLIHGTKDRIAPHNEIEKLAAKNNCKLKSLKGLGHIPFYHPEFLKAVSLAI